MAQEPVGYSGLYPDTQTAWQIINQNTLQVQITQSGTAGSWTDFYTKGVRYQPTPLNIEASLAGSPMGDFFYCGDNNGAPMLFYQPIWTRDIGPNGLIRQLGANSIAVYNTFNVPPFTMSEASGQGTVVSSAAITEEAVIDWTALGPVQYAGTTPSALPAGISAKQAPPYWYHYNHDVFLDMCWNNGDSPIYVWLAVGMSNSVVFSANPAPAEGSLYTEWRTYYENSATWLATAYANHPAVIGFIITNETNSNITTPYVEYWNEINAINTLLKAAAPTKLTMVAMQDDTPSLTNQLIQYTSTPVPGDAPPATENLYLQTDGTIGPAVTDTPALPKHIFQPDVWGWNLYAVPNTSTPSVQYFMDQVGTAYQKPVIITETGIPAALRYPVVANINDGPLGGNDPYFVNPNGYVDTWDSSTQTISVNLYDTSNPALGIESPPIQSTTSTDRISGTFLSNNPQYNGGGLIVYETDTLLYWLLQGNPSATSADWVGLTNSSYLPLLDNWRQNQYTAPAAAIGLWAALQAIYGFMTSNTAAPASQQIYSGVMAFEHADEWFKWVDPSIVGTAADSTAAGVHDFRDTAIIPWGPADAQFYTTWEEEWFGLCSVMANSRNSTDPAINQYGWLNGGADTLTPRALYYAVQNAFSTI